MNKSPSFRDFTLSLYAKKSLPFGVVFLLSVAASYYVNLKLLPKPLPPKEIVTIDINALVNQQVTRLVTATQKNSTILTEDEALAIVTTDINQKLQSLSDTANVIVMPSNAVIAGSSKNITELVGEMK